MAGRIDGFPGIRNWFVAKGDVNQVLSPETAKVVKESLGFQGVKILSVEPGIKNIDIKHVLKEIDKSSAEAIYKDIAKILNINLEDISSILVIIGGLELAKEEVDRLKKSLKKLESKKAEKLADELGLINENNALIFVDEGVGFEKGGLILIETGLKEIKKSIEEEIFNNN